MFKNIRQKINEGFTLIEILIVVVIIGILAAVAIPTYFKYVQRGYASDAKVQMKNIYENSKLYFAENGDEFPETVQDLNVAGYGNIAQSTIDKWDFEINLTMEDDGTITGEIKGTSKDKMGGGAGQEITYNPETGEFTGYGSKALEGSE
tara:strand:- start:286 stop:732 length:447 start_codon:yes stop_codon:yes gene_type:complete